MATTYTLDTLEFAKTMRKAGMPEKQCEALAEELKGIEENSIKNLATKADISLLSQEIKLVRKDLTNIALTAVITICGFLGTVMVTCFNIFL